MSVLVDMTTHVGEWTPDALDRLLADIALGDVEDKARALSTPEYRAAIRGECGALLTCGRIDADGIARQHSDRRTVGAGEVAVVAALVTP